MNNSDGVPAYHNIVIKVGTSTLTHPTGLINIKNIERLVKILSDVKNMGTEIVLVSSGAIGVGSGKLSLSQRPKDMPTKQAAAAVGQLELMYIYDKLFSEYNHTVAQVLLTSYVLDVYKENITNTFKRLRELGVIAIVNENDTVSTEEIEFGDNDNLSALVAVATKADALIILSDINGLYDKNPKTHTDAQLLPEIYKITDSMLSYAENSSTNLGTGGMITKLKAAKYATEAGIDTYIINGKKPDVVYDIIEGKNAGTHFHRQII